MQGFGSSKIFKRGLSGVFFLGGGEVEEGHWLMSEHRLVIGPILQNRCGH